MMSTILRRSARLADLCLMTIPVAALAGGHDHAGHDHADHADHAKTAASAEISVAPANAKTDAAIIAEQFPTYPFDTCVVSGEELGGMGDPYDIVHEGKLVRLCCQGCKDEFAQDPAAFVAKIDAAVIEAQGDSYPLDTCPITGLKLGTMGDPYDHVEGTRLVRFCCAGCIPEFRKDPAKHFAKIDAAREDS